MNDAANTKMQQRSSTTVGCWRNSRRLANVLFTNGIRTSPPPKKVIGQCRKILNVTKTTQLTQTVGPKQDVWRPLCVRPTVSDCLKNKRSGHVCMDSQIIKIHIRRKSRFWYWRYSYKRHYKTSANSQKHVWPQNITYKLLARPILWTFANGEHLVIWPFVWYYFKSVVA